MNPRRLRYAISDRHLAGSPDKHGELSARTHAALLNQAAYLASIGVDIFQLRERDLAPCVLASLTQDLLDVLAGSSTRLLINGRADIAVATGTSGVHLSADSQGLAPAQVHAIYTHIGRPAPFVSVSCHTLGDIHRLQGEPMNAILFGPVFEKSTGGKTVQRGTGLALLRKACELADPLPVMALGGITEANEPSCLAAGASGTAAIRLFLPPI